jgi:hypothetical protein
MYFQEDFAESRKMSSFWCEENAKDGIVLYCKAERPDFELTAGSTHERAKSVAVSYAQSASILS